MEAPAAVEPTVRKVTFGPQPCIPSASLNADWSDICRQKMESQGGTRCVGR
jgi:hypothetical protein